MVNVLPFDSDILGFDRLDMPTVGAVDIYHAIVATFSAGPVQMDAGTVLWFFNVAYGFNSEAQLHAAVDALTTDQVPWVDGLTTCFDIVRIARGELAAMGLGKVTIGEVQLSVSGPDGFLGNHDCLIAGTQEGGVYFIEPQDESFHSIYDPVSWIFPSATSADIDLLMF